MDVRGRTLAAAAALAATACSGRIAELPAGRAASSADAGSDAAAAPAADAASAGADAGDEDPAIDGSAEAATPPGPPLPASCPDGTPRNPSGVCTSCATDTVCCTQALGCAGCCVPDCRLGNRPCMSGLVCDPGSGVCLPEG